MSKKQFAAAEQLARKIAATVGHLGRAVAINRVTVAEIQNVNNHLGVAFVAIGSGDMKTMEAAWRVLEADKQEMLLRAPVEK